MDRTERQPASTRPTAAGRGTRTSPGGRLACRLLEETDFYGSQLQSKKLPTIVTAATPTAAAPVPTAVVAAPARRL